MKLADKASEEEASRCFPSLPAKHSLEPASPGRRACRHLPQRVGRDLALQADQDHRRLSPGGLSDLLGRAHGEYLSQKLGQSVVVENKPGAAGIIAAQAVKASPADGHTLMLMLLALLAHNRVTYKTLPYDPDNDFVLISSIHQGMLPFVAS
jgi:hypothetical protein